MIEYIQNTLIFFIITVVWDLSEGRSLNWLLIIGQSLIFGVILTFITAWYSRRKSRKQKERAKKE